MILQKHDLIRPRASKICFTVYDSLNKKLFFFIKSTNIRLYDVVVFEGEIEQKLWPAHCQQVLNNKFSQKISNNSN